MPGYHEIIPENSKCHASVRSEYVRSVHWYMHPQLHQGSTQMVITQTPSAYRPNVKHLESPDQLRANTRHFFAF